MVAVAIILLIVGIVPEETGVITIRSSRTFFKEKSVKKDTIIETRSIESEVIAISMDKVQLNTRYEWTISGSMEEGRMFEAKAEFAL